MFKRYKASVILDALVSSPRKSEPGPILCQVWPALYTRFLFKALRFHSSFSLQVLNAFYPPHSIQSTPPWASQSRGPTRLRKRELECERVGELEGKRRTGEILITINTPDFHLLCFIGVCNMASGEEHNKITKCVWFSWDALHFF